MVVAAVVVCAIALSSLPPPQPVATPATRARALAVTTIAGREKCTLVRLAGHGPHRDDVGDDEDERDDHGHLEESGVAVAVAQAVDADPTERECQKEEQTAPVGDDEADTPRPGGQVVGIEEVATDFPGRPVRARQPPAAGLLLRSYVASWVRNG